MRRMESSRGDEDQFNSPNPDAPSSPIVEKEKRGGFFSKMAKGVGDAVEKKKQDMADKRREIKSMNSYDIDAMKEPKLPKAPKGVKVHKVSKSGTRIQPKNSYYGTKRRTANAAEAQAKNLQAQSEAMSAQAKYDAELAKYQADMAKYQAYIDPAARERRLESAIEAETKRLANEFAKQGVPNPPTKEQVRQAWAGDQRTLFRDGNVTGVTDSGGKTLDVGEDVKLVDAKVNWGGSQVVLNDVEATIEAISPQGFLRVKVTDGNGNPQTVSVWPQHVKSRLGLDNPSSASLAAPTPTVQAPNSTEPAVATKTAQLKELFELHQMGALTDEEYTAAKAQVLRS